MIGVIEPRAQAACAASSSGRIAVIATDRTVPEGSYENAIHRLMAGSRFARVGARFLHQPLHSNDVEIVEL